MDKKLFNLLFQTPGVSGREEKISLILENELKKNNFKIIKDNLGSTFGQKLALNKNAKTLLIDAHMDEVGMRVTSFTQEGFIKFEEFGAISKYSLILQRVCIFDENMKKCNPGVICSDPNKKGSGNSIISDISDLYIDVGVNTQRELEELGIKIGSIITFDTKTEFIKNRVITKAADDRVGVLLILDLLSFIKKEKFDYNIVIGASVQEEVGIRGARTIAYKVKPDIAMTIDVSPSKDFPKDIGEGKLGGGTMLRHLDRLTIYPKDVINYLRELLNKNKIKWQDYVSLGGTNAGSISLSNSGVPVIPIGLLARNLHTSSLIFDLNDYKNTLDFCKSILKDLNNQKISSFGYK